MKNYLRKSTKSKFEFMCLAKKTRDRSKTRSYEHPFLYPRTKLTLGEKFRYFNYVNMLNKIEDLSELDREYLTTRLIYNFPNIKYKSLSFIAKNHLTSHEFYNWESLISSNPKFIKALYNSCEELQDYKEIEHFIKLVPELSVTYAKEVLKGRFIEGEVEILKHSSLRSKYYKIINNLNREPVLS